MDTIPDHVCAVDGLLHARAVAEREDGQGIWSERGHSGASNMYSSNAMPLGRHNNQRQSIGCCITGTDR